MNKIFPLILFVITLSSCGVSGPAYSPEIKAEEILPGDQVVESDEEKDRLEELGYKCHRQILSQEAVNCEETTVGKVCPAPKVTHGDWICRPYEPLPLPDFEEIPRTIDDEESLE